MRQVNSVREYKEEIANGPTRVRATINYDYNNSTKIVEGLVMQRRIKEFQVSGDDGFAFWLCFPLVRDASFEAGAIKYRTRAASCKVEILSNSRSDK